MPALVYIHGFLSSPRSSKALNVEQWLKRQRPEIRYYCPFLSPYPNEVQECLESLVESLLPQPVYLMGSSMGGFWATYLVEKYNLRAVLINPAVRPFEHMPAYIGKTLKNFHTDHTYCLQPAHIDELAKADVAQVTRSENYWLMVQTGDETLDYRQAVEKYRDCGQLVEPGGDHSFQNFEKWIPEAVTFLETGRWPVSENL